VRSILAANWFHRDIRLAESAVRRLAATHGGLTNQAVQASASRANLGAPSAAALKHRDLDCGPSRLLLCCANKRGRIRV
jgi:hypothetical protein